MSPEGGDGLRLNRLGTFHDVVCLLAGRWARGGQACTSTRVAVRRSPAEERKAPDAGGPRAVVELLVDQALGRETVTV